MKRAKELKPGDKVNGHEYGWLTVISIKKHGYDGTKVRYDTKDGVKEIVYYPHFDMVEVL